MISAFGQFKWQNVKSMDNQTIAITFYGVLWLKYCDFSTFNSIKTETVL